MFSFRMSHGRNTSNVSRVRQNDFCNFMHIVDIETFQFKSLFVGADILPVIEDNNEEA